MNGIINFFQALCGDCISISWCDTDGKNHHIIIDAGFPKTYQATLGKFLREIEQKKESIDLFIITHTDNDHIGGVRPFIREFKDRNIVQKYWFNWSKFSFTVLEEEQISVSQGIELRDYLIDIGKLDEIPITAGTKINFPGAKIQVLSPNADKFEKFKSDWGTKERLQMQKSNYRKISTPKVETSIPVDYLAGLPFVEDNSIENGSSIAFLFEFGCFNILLLGDAYPSVVAQELRNIGYSEKNRLKVNLLKISHHGSKANTSPKLLELIDCDYFVISVNGVNTHGLPNKEALARIAYNHKQHNANKPLHIIFTYNDPRLKSIFSNTEIISYNIQYLFPEFGENYFPVKFISD